MNKEFLSNMAMAELKALARNRGIEIKPRSPKYTIIQNILSYDKKNHYKKLGFESIDEWRKEELVIELKALGNKRGNYRTKKDIVHALQNKGQFPTKNTKNSSKSANKKNDENKNKNKNKTKRKSILKRKEENLFKAFVGLENVILNVFRDLQDGFKPVDEKRKLPHSYNDWQNKLVIPEDLGELLDEFGDKILQLLPLILEIKSITNDFKKYKQKLIKYKANKNQEKKTYFLGMKKYKKKKHYNNDEIGPICGVFDNIKKFQEWKNDKKVKKMYGKNIFRAKYVETNKKNDNNEKDKNNENESESEIEMESEQEEDESLSDDDEQDQEDDMIPSDQDEDIGNNYKSNNNDHDDDDETDVAEIVITNQDETTQDETTQDETTQDDEDDDTDVDMNKNKNKSRTITKKPAMTKNTRSRREAATKKKKVSGRKRRRDNDQDTHDDNDGEPNRKRARLNKSTKK